MIIVIAALFLFGGRFFGEKKGVDVNISAPSKIIRDLLAGKSATAVDTELI